MNFQRQGKSKEREGKGEGSQRRGKSKEREVKGEGSQRRGTSQRRERRGTLINFSRRGHARFGAFLRNFRKGGSLAFQSQRFLLYSIKSFKNVPLLLKSFKNVPLLCVPLLLCTG